MTDPNVVPVQPVQPVAYQPVARPGRGLGIAGLIIDFFVAPLGLILSIVAKVQSSRAGVKNGPATVGIVLGIIFTIGYVIAAIAIGAGIGALASECANLGSGTHTVNGMTYTCGS